MLIYAIRHGQTDWNLSGRLQGSRDINLNATGREQARRNGLMLGRLLGDEARRFDYVASPLKRTCETMEIIRAAMKLDPSAYRTDRRLIELSFGDWEGLTLEEVALHHPERIHGREENKWTFLPPGDAAESYEMLARRVERWLETVTRETVCVCHGGIIRSLFHLCGGLDGIEAAVADTPQDRILKVADGRLEWLDPSGQATAV
ncbi:MAG: histidine phosphatase family protein [Pararhizobium sp.]